MVTIYDVARLAGVSAATVSRYVSQSVGVKASTAERIRQAIVDTGFERNQLASALTTKRTGLIGFLTSDLLNPFTAEIAHAMTEEAGEAGFSLLTAVTAGREDRFLRMLSDLRQHQVDAIIATPPETPAIVDALRDLVRAGTPVTTIGIDLDEPAAGFVSVDTYAGARAGVDHLIGLGHRRIGFIAGPDPRQTGRGRFAGYTDALKAARLRPAASLVARSSLDREGGADALEKLLSAARPPSAVLCLNDLLALGALQATHTLRIRVPEQLSIVGFDDIAMAAYAAPPLTTVAQPKTELGRTAAQMIINQLNSSQAPTALRLPCHLVVRGSTGPPGPPRKTVP